MQLSKQMAQLRPELTMPMFSGKFQNYSMKYIIYLVCDSIFISLYLKANQN